MAFEKASLHILAVAAFACICVVFRDFVLDDSFITYRFAENWARLGVLTWNPGMDPVEGFTSFAWVGLNAVGILVNLDPVWVSRAISAFCMAAMLGVFAFGLPGLTLFWRIILMAGMGLSGAMALHVMQGMETVLASALLLLTSLGAACAYHSSKFSRHLCWMVPGFAAALTRPEAALFAIIAGLSLVAVYLYERRIRALVPLSICAAGAVAAGTGYMIWRVEYFGHLFPNTFYIKQDAGYAGILYTWEFFALMLSPYVIVSMFMLSKFSGRFDKLKTLLPIFLAIAGMLAYFLTINPIQGYLYRFPVILYPAFLWMIGYGLSRLPADAQQGVFRPKWLGVALLALFIVWPLQTLPEGIREMRKRSQHDRVQVGKALNDMQGRMFVTEAGALPYYSRWTAIDSLGLVSERIAHEGLSADVLENFKPDVMMSIVFGHVLQTGQDTQIMARTIRFTCLFCKSGFSRMSFDCKGFDWP